MQASTAERVMQNAAGWALCTVMKQHYRTAFDMCGRARILTLCGLTSQITHRRDQGLGGSVLVSRPHDITSQ